ncbi:membrane protein [Microbacterium phage Zooman]|nr:membrane protein [Microbacterium phage Zooman]
MDKPRSFIHVKSTSKFSEFGVLVIGRIAIPIYLILNSALLLTLMLGVAGGVLAATTRPDQQWWLLIASAVPLTLVIVSTVIVGFINIIAMFARDIKKATKDLRGDY